MRQSIPIYFFAILFVFTITSCKNEKNKDINTGEQTTESSDTVLSIESYADFLAIFPEIEEIPTSDMLFSYSLNRQETDKFSDFSSFIKYNMFGDYSDEAWNYQPLFKIKTKDGYITFMVSNKISYDYRDENEIDYEDFVFMRWKIDEDGKYKHETWPYLIGKRKGGKIVTQFKFLSNDFENIEISAENEPKTLVRYFEGNYYSVKKWMLVTDEMSPPDYKMKDIITRITLISDLWSLKKELKKESADRDSINRELSLLFNKKTKFGKKYLHSPQDMVPILNFLGCKMFPDSTYLLIWESGIADYDEGEIKICLIKDVGMPIDFVTIPNNDIISNNINVLGDEVQIFTESNGESNNSILIPSKFGFIPKKDQFQKQINAYNKFSFPLIVDRDWVQDHKRESFLSFLGAIDIMGKIETNSQTILLTYDFEEITSGSHSVSVDIIGKCYDKKTFKDNGDCKFYFMFSDSGDESTSLFENGILIQYDKYEDQETYEEIFKPSDTLYITNYGFYRNYCIPVHVVDPNLEITSLFKDLDNSLDVNRLVENEIESYKYSKNDTLFSRYIGLQKFSKHELEPFIPICVPLGKMALNDTISVMLWNRIPNCVGSYSGNCKSVLEAAVFNTSSINEYILIEEIPLWMDQSEEILGYLRQLIEN